MTKNVPCTTPIVRHGHCNSDQISATCQCDPGYTLIGSSSLSCNRTVGVWGGKLPVCSLEFLDSRSSLLSSSTCKPNDERRDSWCNWGYSMIGTSHMLCSTTSTPSWESNPPECYLDLINEPNGYMNSNGVSVSYYCKGAYSMTGSPSLECINGTWTGTIPTCTLQFLDSAWFWVLVSLAALALLSCLAWLCCRRCFPCCGGRWRRRRRGGRDVEGGYDDDDDDCCNGCCRSSSEAHDGCCDYYGCCGYTGCCSCCCWCCRCCREPIEPETELRVIKSTNRKSKKSTPQNIKLFTVRRKKNKQKKSDNKVPKLDFSKINKKTRRNSTGMLPTTRTVQSLVVNDTAKFRRVAKIVPVWLPHSQPIRNLNTSTK